MEETQNVCAEVAMDDELFFDPADFPDEEGGDHTAEEEGADGEEQGEQPAEEPAAEDGQPEEPEGQPQEEPEYLELDYLDAKKKVTKEEAKNLAQMGLNHDRMKQQRDDMRNALQEQLNWRSQNEEHLDAIGKLAEAAGMDMATFVDSMKENLYVRQGLSRDAAKERVEKERIQRQLDAKTRQETNEKQASEAKMMRAQREVADFERMFPEVDKKSIPESVFQEAASGAVSLTGAYISHLNSQLKAENERLTAEVKAYKQNEKNKKNAVGSAKTQGNKSTYDDFLRGFDDE